MAFECSASTSSGDVQQASGPSVERELVFIKRKETSVKILLAEFHAQATSRKACYANKQEAHAPAEVFAKALERSGASARYSGCLGCMEVCKRDQGQAWKKEAL